PVRALCLGRPVLRYLIRSRAAIGHVLGHALESRKLLHNSGTWEVRTRNEEGLTMATSTRKPGPMSAADYRIWQAAHGHWQSHWLRPEPEHVDRAMAQLSASFGQADSEIVKPLMARAAYTSSERADVVADVRQAITVGATAAWRVARDGGRLTDNLLFDEIARRWS